MKEIKEIKQQEMKENISYIYILCGTKNFKELLEENNIRTNENSLMIIERNEKMWEYLQQKFIEREI